MTDTSTRTANTTYRGAAGIGAPRLSGLGGVQRDDVGAARVLEVERYDTDDHRLTAAGISLAVHRDGEAQPHWQLDLPDGDAGDRLRVPVVADAGVPPAVPGELDELVRGAARERAVRPAGRVRRVRTETRLLAGDDRLLALLVHDEVTLATLGRSTEVEAWTEVELRRVDADDALVVELEGRLADAGLGPAAPAAEAELDRLLRPAPPAGPRRRGRSGSAGAVLVDYLAAQVDRISTEELRVRRGEPDSVHQLRVASRRLRSALQAYRPLLDRTRTDPLVDGLRDFGRELAAARDTEVLHQRISTGLRGLGPELLLGPAQAQVTRHFARAEAEARAGVLSTLDDARYLRLRIALDTLVDRPPLRKGPAAKPARKQLAKVAARSAQRLERAVTAATDPAVPEADRDVAVHSARKAGKRLRYATEVARPAVGKPAKKFTRALKGLQSALGDHQDTVVARGTLRELGAQAHAAGQNGFSFGVLHGLDAARAAEIERQLPELWKSAWKPANRTWLG